MRRSSGSTRTCPWHERVGWFGRHPRLRVLIAEHGASWVPHTLHHIDKSRGMGRNGPWIGGSLGERPSAVFKRHVRVAPYPEDDIGSGRRNGAATASG